MSALTMSKKQKRTYNNAVRQQENLAGECNVCKALLAKAKPARQQNTRVYATRGQIRYCCCGNCGTTWKKVIVLESKT